MFSYGMGVWKRDYGMGVWKRAVGGKRLYSQVNVGIGSAGFAEQIFPVRAWLRNPAFRSWPVMIFVVLVTVPPVALVIFFQNPSQSTFGDAAGILAAYFAVAWLLLLGMIVRPAQVTRRLEETLVGGVGVVNESCR
jgi:hypothetical protein